MDLGSVEKKIRETEFFLDRMRDVEARALPVAEQFDFYLSAHLNAGRAVETRLDQEHASFGAWRRKWTWANGPADDLLRFFSDDPKVEVKESGPKRMELEKTIDLGLGPRPETASTTTVTGPPGSFPLGSAGKRDHFFKIDGVEHKATDACAEYVKVLKRMVAEFKAAHP